MPSSRLPRLPSDGSKPAPTRVRDLSWDGCVNIRDLGGHPTEDGGTTRFGAVVRADSIRQLTDAGWAALVGYGITTVVDLRFARELEADPLRELPVDVVHISLLGDGAREYWEGVDALGAAAADEAMATRAVYLELLEQFRDNFATTVAAVARAPEGGVLIHCQGGKDRTGLVSALLLRLAGVGVAEIATDYAESERNLAPMLTQWITEAEGDDERRLRVRIAATPAQAMLDVVTELERRYGSIAAYLRAGGASSGELERARRRLRA